MEAMTNMSCWFNESMWVCKERCDEDIGELSWTAASVTTIRIKARGLYKA